MAEGKKTYLINIHCPEDEKGILLLRNKLKDAYIDFIKNYIIDLPVNDNQKNELYSKILNQLSRKRIDKK